MKLQTKCLYVYLSVILLYYHLVPHNLFSEVINVIKKVEEQIGRFSSFYEIEQLALKRAKKLALEEAGSFIKSRQILKNQILISDNIELLSAAIIQSEILENKRIIKDNIVFIKMTIRFSIDTSVLKKKVENELLYQAHISKSHLIPVKISEMAQIKGKNTFYLCGYGYIIDLNGTGDRIGRTYKYLKTELQYKKITKQYGSKALDKGNVAYVGVYCNIPSFAKKNYKFDVLVSCIEDATNINGGFLLSTTLYHNKNKKIKASAKGYVYTKCPLPKIEIDTNPGRPLTIREKAKLIKSRFSMKRIRRRGLAKRNAVKFLKDPSPPDTIGKGPNIGIIIENESNNKENMFFLHLKKENLYLSKKISETINQKFEEQISYSIDSKIIKVENKKYIDINTSKLAEEIIKTIIFVDK